MNTTITISYACFQQILTNAKQVENILEQLISSGAEPDDLCHVILDGAVACFQQILTNAKQVENILEQLISSGAEPDDLCYEQHVDQGFDVILDGAVRVCLIRHENIGQETWPNIPLGFKSTLTLYPDGRPDGWPELSLEDWRQRK